MNFVVCFLSEPKLEGLPPAYPAILLYDKGCEPCDPLGTRTGTLKVRKRQKTSLFHKWHLKANGGCSVFWTSPTSSQQPVLLWGTVTGHISHEVYGNT